MNHQPNPITDTSSVVAWLIDGARSAKSPQDTLAQLCTRLVEAGVRLERVKVFVQTLHPNIMGRSFAWRPGQEVEISEAPYAVLGSPEYRVSPVAQVKMTGIALRRRLADPQTPRDYPVIIELDAEGFTDFLCSPLIFGNGEIHNATWATRAPGGFSAEEIAGLEAITAPLARVAEIWALRRVAINLLNTYVGRGSGARILEGNIRRGDVEEIEAVIWLSDLRDFTPRADKLPSADLISLLNRFFECQTPAIARHGGEVLKFIGDGLLAIFPVADDKSRPKTCAAALAAARAAALELTDAVGALGYGLALHMGRVAYGNIGGGDRLDFTCIGPAVNMVARLEKVSADLKQPIVASAMFAKHLPNDFSFIGEFALKGFEAHYPVYGLRGGASGNAPGPNMAQ